MKFKNLKLKNIRSYEKLDIDFSEGSMLLSGDIGSGKTTILLAIEFALFGLQPGQKGASILKNGKDEGIVELCLDIDEKEVTIIRTLKRKKTINQETTFIVMDGETKEFSITESKNIILNLINYPSEFSKKTNFLYRFTVYTPQEEMKSIILENPEVRMNTLRHIFGVDKYKRIKENSLIFSSRLREIIRGKQGQINDLDKIKELLNEKEENLNNLKKFIPTIEEEIKFYCEKVLEKEKEISEIRNKIFEKNKLENEKEKSQFMITAKQNNMKMIMSENERILEQIKNCKDVFDNEKLNKISEEIDKMKKIKDEKNSEIIAMNIRIKNIEDKKLDIQSLREKITNLKICPTCMQQVNIQHKSNLFENTRVELLKSNEEITELKKNYENNQNEISELSEKILKLKYEKESLEEVKRKLERLNYDKIKIDENNKKIIELKRDIELLEEQQILINKSIPEFKKFENLSMIKESEFKDLSNKQKEFEIKKAEKLKEIYMTEEEIKRVNDELSNKEKIKRDLEYTTEVERWISNEFLEMVSFIERNVLVKLREEFSLLFKKWLSLLVPESLEVSIDEDFSPQIMQQGYQLEYNFLSGGEKTAVALAYRLALNQIINTIFSEIKTKGVVILDEPTDGFSESQIDKIRDVFQQLNLKQLIIVSHDQKIESFVNKIIKLKKDEGISKMIL